MLTLREHVKFLMQQTGTPFSSGDINICWSNWKARFMQVMLECIPQSSLKSHRILAPLTHQADHASDQTP